MVSLGKTQADVEDSVRNPQFKRADQVDRHHTDRIQRWVLLDQEGKLLVRVVLKTLAEATDSDPGRVAIVTVIPPVGPS